MSNKIKHIITESQGNHTNTNQSDSEPPKPEPVKNIILLVSSPTKESLEGFKKYAKENNQQYRIAWIFDPKKITEEDEKNALLADITIPCNTSDWLKMEKALLPYKKEIIAVNCRREVDMKTMKQIIPHLPHVKAPTSESLEWSTDKLLMREKLTVNNSKIVPKFMVATDSDPKTLQKIKDDIGFPLVIKPANLAASLFVTVCYHKEELEENLHKLLKKIETAYKDNQRQSPPQLLVEEFIEGDMYSVDAYVSQPDKIEFCPLVYIKTGKTIGFDDFFGYLQITPTNLKPEFINSAREVATQAINALGLKHTTVHIEMFKNQDEWKIIELGPRVGGFRHELYKLSCNIDHYLNDILIKVAKKTIVPKKCTGFAAAMKFFAKEEGILTELKGIKKIENLKSIQKISVNKKIGDKCLYAKNGGRSVFNLILFNKDRSELLADIRRIEQTVVIKTSKAGDIKNKK